jgi:hypothetical protein
MLFEVHSSIRKMEVAGSSKTSVPIYVTIGPDIPEDLNSCIISFKRDDFTSVIRYHFHENTWKEISWKYFLKVLHALKT